MKTNAITSVIKSLVIWMILGSLLLSCTSGGAGTDAGSQTSSGVTGLSLFDDEATQLAAAFPADYSPDDVYALGLSLAASQSSYGVSDAEAAPVLDGLFIDPVLRELIDDLLLNGYTLSQLSTKMTGAYADPAQAIVLGLDLEEEIPANSPITVGGTPAIVEGIGSGNGMEFNEVGDYLLIPADAGNNLAGDGGTIELWLKPNVNKLGAGIIHKGTAADWSDESYSLQYNQPGELAFILTNTTDVHTYVVSTAPRLVEGTWYHIVVTWDQSTIWLYVNGVDVAKKYIQLYADGSWGAWTTTLPADFAPIRDSDADVVVGTQLPDSEPEYRFDGVLDKLRLYSRTMDEVEVQDHYQNP